MKIIPLLLTFATVPSVVMGVDNNWTGTTSTDWNTGTNWSDPHTFGSPHVPTNGAGHPGDEDAVINISTGNIATITADILSNPRDLKVGIGGGTNGRVNHNAGTAGTGAGNWAFIGVDGGTGVYNLANTGAAGGAFSGFGTGSGSLNVGGLDPANGRLYVGGQDNANGGTGTMNINTTGTLKIGHDFFVGRGGGTGTVNMDAGTVNRTGGWLAVGHLPGSNGTFRQSGGSLTGTGTTTYGNDGGTGSLLLTGGSHSTAGEMYFGNGTANAGATLGNGTGTVNGGSLSSGSWMGVGRNGSTGVLTINGGTVSQGATDAGSRLELTNANANTGSGTVNLNGGTLTVNGIVEGGAAAVSTFNFNGGTLVARAAQVDFMEGLTAANVQAGGAIIDSNGVDITISQQLLAAGGGLTKIGSGKLTLDATNTYTGGTTVTGGTLSVDGAGGKLGTGNVSVLTTVVTLSINSGVLDAIGNTATLSLAGGGAAGLADFGFATLGLGINETVGGLILGGSAQVPGTYGSAASPATFKSNEYFSGAGILTVVPEPSAALSMLGGLGMLFGLRRRRK